MVMLLVYDLLFLLLILHMNKRGAGWDDRHRLALINGALGFFLVLGPLTVGPQYPVMYFSNPVFLFVLGLIYWKVSKRYSSTDLEPKLRGSI